MVRWVWQNRLVLGIARLFRLFLRWLLIWLSYLARNLTRNLDASRRVLSWLIRPRDPNNLFVTGLEGSHHAEEMGITGLPDVDSDDKHTTLLWATQEPGRTQPGAALETNALSLWRGTQSVSPEDSMKGAQAANRRFAYIDVLAAQIKRLSPTDIEELDSLILRLARKWLDIDQSFEHLPRRNRLDIGRTLRYNIPRYAGKILNFQWTTKERPVPQLAKPAKILVIGDVSHSMVHYVSILLYFFHKLNFKFVVESYVFSEQATHSTPFLNGLGTFDEKVKRLIAGAKSWNAGTRFGSALEEIATHATVDEYTYVIIATDGKVSLKAEEAVKIERHMTVLRDRAKQVIFVTPSVEFSDGAAGKVRPERVGSFKYDFFEIPVYSVGPPLWYGILGQYAARLYLVRTVQDLIDMTENLVLASQE